MFGGKRVRLGEAFFLILLVAHVASGSDKKPLFEYDDHYVMLNDFGRNEFYRQSLQQTMSDACLSKECVVLDVGAGSGLLSMQAALFGAKHVLAMEANPALASLAKQTIERNQWKFPETNVTVLAGLSSKVTLDQLPMAMKADLLVTETFGTMLLGESAMNFIPDVRDRLLKTDGLIVPAGGCQYITLVESADLASIVEPTDALEVNLTRMTQMQDTLYWKGPMGATSLPMRRLTKRLCVLEVDFYTDTRDSIPMNRTFRVQASQAGVVHAALFDWDVWADRSREGLLSTSPGARNFAGDVAWGWLVQMQEDEDQTAELRRLHVEAGDEIDVLVDYIAGGISLHVRARHATNEANVTSPRRSRQKGLNRAERVEANDFYLPVAGDTERQAFYRHEIADAVKRLSVSKPLTVLDCSANLGIPALLSAVDHHLPALVLTRTKGVAELIQEVASDNNVASLVEAYALEPRDLIEALLPLGKKADIVVLEAPGTPVPGFSPFAVLPVLSKLLAPGGLVIPGSACLEVGLLESEELSHLHSVPMGRWEDIDLTVWNEEARRQHVLERVVPYRKWLGLQSTLRRKWLTSLQCLYHVDLNQYTTEAVNASVHSLPIISSGHAHAVVARWVLPNGQRWLGADSTYLGRSLTWPHYVQPLASSTQPGILDPVDVQKGTEVTLRMVILQGAAKKTGAAGPEFHFEVHKGKQEL